MQHFNKFIKCVVIVCIFCLEDGQRLTGSDTNRMHKTFNYMNIFSDGTTATQFIALH